MLANDIYCPLDGQTTDSVAAVAWTVCVPIPTPRVGSVLETKFLRQQMFPAETVFVGHLSTFIKLTRCMEDFRGMQECSLHPFSLLPISGKSLI